MDGSIFMKEVKKKKIVVKDICCFYLILSSCIFFTFSNFIYLFTSFGRMMQRWVGKASLPRSDICVLLFFMQFVYIYAGG